MKIDLNEFPQVMVSESDVVILETTDFSNRKKVGLSIAESHNQRKILCFDTYEQGTLLQDNDMGGWVDSSMKSEESRHVIARGLTLNAYVGSLIKALENLKELGQVEINYGLTSESIDVTIDSLVKLQNVELDMNKLRIDRKVNTLNLKAMAQIGKACHTMSKRLSPEREKKFANLKDDPNSIIKRFVTKQVIQNEIKE